ncbi:hypothetical protein ACP70R_033893 [Stipagrostis hirtigluma subsp. patula]
MAPPPPWADGLPAGVLDQVVRRVPCCVDRSGLKLVCRSWGAAVARLVPPPAALPWLLLPSGGSARAYCLLSDCCSHHQFHGGPAGGRCFGSYDGSCVFVAWDQPGAHRLFDLRARKAHVLPNLLRTRRHHPSTHHVDRMFILAATLSAPPDDPNCVAAGIVAYQRDGAGPLQRRIAFWRLGAEVAFDHMLPRNLEPAVEDVVFRGGAFHFLTRGEDIITCAPPFIQEGDQLGGGATFLRFLPRDRSKDNYIRARYLAQSRGELMMILRFAPHPEMPTSAFKVFRVMLNHDGDRMWTELHSLGGRTLFVGRACSRCYETGEYPGFKDVVYFLDDSSFYDDDILFRRADDRQYPCRDSGKWSNGPDPCAVLFFPDEGPSSYSSPAWLIAGQAPVLEDLPDDALEDIARRLKCDAVVARMPRPWRQALTKLQPLPAQLPWLVRKLPGGPAVSCLLCGDGADAAIHYVQAPAYVRGARFIGSYEGRWLLLDANRARDHRILNVLTGHCHSLPSKVTFLRDGGSSEMIIMAVALSCAPDDESCVCVAITHLADSCENYHPMGYPIPNQLSYWKMGANIAIDPSSETESPNCTNAEDVTFYRGEFYMLTGRILQIWKPSFREDGSLAVDTNRWNFKIRYGDYPLEAAYLVESRGDLLIVFKITTARDWKGCRGWKSCPAERFMVGRLENLEKRKRHVEAEVEPEPLDGRMLFLGRGCSRAYEVAQYPSIPEGIYFSDDRSFYDINGIVKNIPLLSSDNGRWLEPPLGAAPPAPVEYCFPPHQDRSDCSGPIWLLP